MSMKKKASIKVNKEKAILIKVETSVPQPSNLKRFNEVEHAGVKENHNEKALLQETFMSKASILTPNNEVEHVGRNVNSDKKSHST